MASLQKIPSIAKFARVSLVASFWGLFLTPFCVGFAGKSGFTSMMGHVTHYCIEKCLWEKVRNRLNRKQRLQEEREAINEEQQRLRQEEEEKIRRKKREEEEEKQCSIEENQIREADERQKASEPYHPPRKPSRKKELVFSTKQQRRQQQRLKQQQQKQERPIKPRDISTKTKTRHRSAIVHGSPL